MATIRDEEVKPQATVAKDESVATTQDPAADKTSDELNSKVEAISLGDQNDHAPETPKRGNAEGDNDENDEDNEAEEDDEEASKDGNEVIELESLCMKCHENV